MFRSHFLDTHFLKILIVSDLAAADHAAALADLAAESADHAAESAAADHAARAALVADLADLAAESAAEAISFNVILPSRNRFAFSRAVRGRLSSGNCFSKLERT